MPTYSYKCTECDNRFDVVQAFTDDTLTTCEQCSGRLRKLFNSVGVVFKGSGFYRNDSREAAKKSQSSTNGSAASDSSSSDSKSSDSKSGDSKSSETKSGDSKTSSSAEKTTSSTSPSTASASS